MSAPPPPEHCVRAVALQLPNGPYPVLFHRGDLNADIHAHHPHAGRRSLDWRGTVSKAYGEKWCKDKRSLILIVPSVVARVDHNILINPAHPEFSTVTTGPNEPVYWDARLFRA